jgi:radical SAM protein with 4Fe4S-binding SPASM domain
MKNLHLPDLKLLDGAGTCEDTLDWRPELTPGLVHRQRDERELFVHPSKPRWILLNRSAADLARRFDGRSSLAELAAGIASETGADASLVGEDLLQVTRVLKQRGFLLSEADQKHMGRAFYITGMFLRVTDACNLRCTQCYADSFGPLSSKKNELTTQEIKDLLLEVHGMGGRSITFSGGEPLLRPDMLSLVEYAANELDMKVKLNSNGTTLLAHDAAKRLAVCLDELQVSLDGATAEVHDAVRGRGSFKRTLAGIEAFAQAGGLPKLCVSLTLMKGNIGSAKELATLARSLGVPTIRFLNVVNDGRASGSWADMPPSTEDLVAFYDELYFGELGGSDLVVHSGMHGFFPQIPEDFANECMLCPVSMSPGISPQGDVYPCSMFERPQHKVGNLRESGGLQGILDNGGLQSMRETMSVRPQEISQCSQCDWRGLCQSGCAGMVDMAQGHLRSPDGFCEVRDHLYSKLIFENAGKSGGAEGCGCSA